MYFYLISRFWFRSISLFYNFILESAFCNSYTFLIFVLFIPTRYIFDSAENYIWFGPPGINALKNEYYLTLVLIDKLDQGDSVIAPYEVSLLLPMFKGGYWPVIPRDLEFNNLRNWPGIDPKDIELRQYLLEFTNHETDMDLDLIRESIDYFDVAGFVVPRSLSNLQLLDAFLLSEGFTAHDDHFDYKYWVR